MCLSLCTSIFSTRFLLSILSTLIPTAQPISKSSAEKISPNAPFPIDLQTRQRSLIINPGSMGDGTGAEKLDALSAAPFIFNSFNQRAVLDPSLSQNTPLDREDECGLGNNGNL